MKVHLFVSLAAVFRILDILVRIRILRSVHLISGPDPAFFVSDFQDGNKKSFFKFFCFFLSVGTYIHTCPFSFPFSPRSGLLLFNTTKALKNYPKSLAVSGLWCVRTTGETCDVNWNFHIKSDQHVYYSELIGRRLGICEEAPTANVDENWSSHS